MDSPMMSSETLDVYQQLKQIKEFVGELELDVHKILELDTKEFIHVFTELSQLLHQLNSMHEQLIPRAEYMLEHKNETLRTLRKETFRLVK